MVIEPALDGSPAAPWAGRSVESLSSASGLLLDLRGARGLEGVVISIGSPAGDGAEVFIVGAAEGFMMGTVRAPMVSLVSPATADSRLRCAGPVAVAMGSRRGRTSQHHRTPNRTQRADASSPAGSMRVSFQKERRANEPHRSRPAIAFVS